jgi:hypothetical protein
MLSSGDVMAAWKEKRDEGRAVRQVCKDALGAPGSSPALSVVGAGLEPGAPRGF